MSNIKLTNGIKISQESIYGINSYDKNNIIASGSTKVDYTATEDCLVIAGGETVQWTSGGYGIGIAIDGIRCFECPGPPVGLSFYAPIQMVKGQVLKRDDYGSSWKYTAYGFKS